MSITCCPVIAAHVRIPMRDGVCLSAHIYRPAVKETVPALMQYTPYRKGVLAASHPYVEQGYAVVIYDVRGTGDSEGGTSDVYSAEERQDGYDMVEWIAAQPWCNGNVGMYGISYGAIASLQTAMQAPPHLKAIIVRSGTDDIYTEWTNPGGSPRPFMYECYAAIMAGMHFSPPHPEAGGDWESLWRERLAQNTPWGISFINNLVDGPYWRERSLRPEYSRIRCPIFVIEGWADWYYTPVLRIFAHVDVPKRALIGPWSHQWPSDALPGPRVDGDRECLRWFDHWLKGIDTGMMDEPPVTLFVRDYAEPATFRLEERGAFRCEQAWPIARTQETAFHLHPGGILATDPASEGSDTYVYNPAVGVTSGLHGGGPFAPSWTMPLDQRMDDALSLTYTTAPLAEDTEITGHPRAVLHIASTATATFFAVKLCDVAPDGTSVLVSTGYLNTSHRASHSDPSPIAPGEIYELDIEILACAYRVAAGHRLRVSVACADFQNAWPLPEPCVNTVHYGAAHPSRVLLPVVPPQQPALPAPNLLPSPLPLPAREELDAPVYTLTRDVITGTLTTAYEAPFDNGMNRGSFTISLANPAHAVARGDATFTYQREDREIVVRARCVTTSDAEAFHHTTTVVITQDGWVYFEKEWSASVPRRYV